MYIFYDIGYVVLAALFFIIFHWLHDRFIIQSRYFKKLGQSYTTLFWSNFYYGVIILGTEIIIWLIDDGFSLSIGLTMAIILAMIRGYRYVFLTFLFVIIFELFYFWTSQSIIYNFWISSFLLIVVYEIMHRLWPNFWLKILLVTISLLYGTISYLTYFLTNVYPFDDRLLVERSVFFPFALGVILALALTSINFLVAAQVLLESNLYTFARYYRHPAGVKAIEVKIREQKIAHALVLIFEHQIRLKKFEDDELTLEEVNKQFLQAIANRVDQSAILFNLNEHVHGIFYPLEAIHAPDLNLMIANNNLQVRPNQDILSRFEKLFYGFISPQENDIWSKFSIGVNLGASIYGLHDCSLSKLEDNAIFAMRYDLKSQNLIKVFRPQLLIHEFNDSMRLQKMDSHLRIDDYEIVYWKILSNHPHQALNAISVFANVLATSENRIGVLRQYLKLTNWIVDFDRYFALEILKRLATSTNIRQIFLWYQVVLEAKIDEDALLAKLRQINVDSSSLVFVVKYFGDENLATIQSNLELCRRLEIKVAFYNLVDQKKLAIFNPDFIFLSPDFYHHHHRLRNFTCIFSEIRNSAELQNALDYKALLSCGSYLFESSTLQKIDKKVEFK